jgi:protein disulfide-isomerase A6
LYFTINTFTMAYRIALLAAMMGARAVLGLYAGSDVVEVTDGNFAAVKSGSDPLFLEFYAPWCGHCQNLAPKWKNVASELKGKVRVAAVNCDENRETCGQYGIQGFPTIKFLAEGGTRTIDYNGPREESDLVTFAMNEWTASRPPPTVTELTSPSVMREQCMGNQLCFVAMLPHILDSKAVGRRKYLDMVKELAKTYRDRPFGYVWSEGGAQPELEAALEATFGTPSFFAVAPSKNKFSHLKSGFSTDNLKEFIDNVRRGHEPVSSTSADLKDVSISTIQAWDGKDAAIEMEEEFSLEDLGL